MITNLSKTIRYVFGMPVQVDIPALARAYRIAYASPSGKRHLLPDMLHYTGVLMPAPLHGDAFAQGRVQGRRDVGLHVLEHLTLDPIELYAIVRGQPIINPGDYTNG